MPRGRAKSKAAEEEVEETEQLDGMEKVIANAADGKIRDNIEGFVEWVAENYDHELDAADAQIVITGYKYYQKSDEAVERRETRAAALEEERAAKAAEAENKTVKKTVKKAAKKSPAAKRTAKKGAAKKRTTKKVAAAEEAF